MYSRKGGKEKETEREKEICREWEKTPFYIEMTCSSSLYACAGEKSSLLTLGRFLHFFFFFLLMLDPIRVFSFISEHIYKLGAFYGRLLFNSSLKNINSLISES